MQYTGSLRIYTEFPQSPLLREHISHYYFLSNDSPAQPLEFWHYPHYNATLNILKGGETWRESNARFILENASNPIKCFYTNNAKCAKKSIITGAYNIIGVVFRPLGINHFTTNSLGLENGDICQNDLIRISSKSLEKSFTVDQPRDKAAILDKVFEEAFRDFVYPVLRSAVTGILKAEGNVSLGELSDDLQVNRRTLLRYFRRFLGYSFRDFKGVVKFRFSLNQGLNKADFGTLSELAYRAHYYDQSDFIKQFKQKTNETPGRAFTTIERVSEQLLWKLP